jgi:predicted dehydrogenase
MINLGIVGLGPVWESRYRPVLDKLQHRVRIRAVFDPVASRCDEVAATLRAAPYQGVLALLTHADVRGILLLDSSWYGNALIHFLGQMRKPVYVAGSLGEDPDELARLRSLVESEGLLVMPEFSRRFTPATCRLHELIATRIGRPRHIAIDAIHPAPNSTEAIPGQKAGTDLTFHLAPQHGFQVNSIPTLPPARHTTGAASAASGMAFRSPKLELTGAQLLTV